VKGGVGTFIVILILLWFIAPQQTEHMITSVVTAISNRIDESAKDSAANN
jgi:hypothetical protein